MRTMRIVLLVLLGMFFITVKLVETEGSQLETKWGYSTVILKSKQGIRDEQLLAFEIFHQAGSPHEKLRLEYRDENLAVYQIVKSRS